ncbi:MAG: hypothetical protein K2X50_07020 [Gammaproteobacteria bacterium]|nr:hypothetical protein [Gammaproteobacteria bacterium]
MWPFNPKQSNESKDATSDPYIWIPVGDNNPFNAPIMDIRAFTQNMISTTKDRSIALKYTQSRGSNGLEFVGKMPQNPMDIHTRFTIPHNGDKLEGIVYKSPVMEVKWDIYAYDNWFYFVRSWTSELIYRVQFINTGPTLEFIKIIVAQGKVPEYISQDIYSIILTHALNRVWPYHLPQKLHSVTGDNIAIFMYALFGSKATLVTKENVMKIQLLDDGVAPN